MAAPDLSSRVLTLELELAHSLRQLDAVEKRIEEIKREHDIVTEKINRAILLVAVGALALIFHIIRTKIGM